VIAVAAVLARQGRHRRGPAVTAVAEMELEAA